MSNISNDSEGIFPSNSNSGDSNIYESQETSTEETSVLQKIQQIERKDTNYIFLFGKRASGKSYITASLIYYMQICKYGTLHVSDSNSRDSEMLVDDMYKNFHTGKIMDRTNRLAPPYEIDLVFTPKDRKLPVMRITFLEMAGENLEKVQITRNDLNSGKLPDNIDIFLKAHNCRLFFFLVTSHETAQEDSLAINKFLTYIYNKNERFDNANYLLAITKWDTYRGRHRKIEDFTLETMPNIHNRLLKEHLGNAITHYSIGRIRAVEDKGKMVDQIESIDTSRAEAVTAWLYESITKKSLVPKPTVWDRIKKSFGI